jgi:peptidyl-prolyl cis-trans isomerase C
VLGDSGPKGWVGWLLISQTADPIAEAIQSVLKGQVAAKPLPTQFGWHVIKVDDIKAVSIDSFEQSKTV